ncbi:MAG TPA: DNA/RNA helicase [Mariprofundaceae bacterium]|nr:DNA/RNA helicase [Mariprofundaceae bacterium]
MPAEITQAFIEDNFDSKYLEQGRDYFKSGQVESLQFDAEKHTITAQVMGSNPKPHTVSISYDEFDIDGDCDCPLQFNCQHVAAALYAVLTQTSSLPRKKRKKKEEPVPFHSWLGVSGQTTSASLSRNDYPSDVRQRLLYIIRSDGKNRLRIHFESIRLLKDGKYGKATPYSCKSILSRNVPRYILSMDERILRDTAASLSPGEDSFLLQGIAGQEMLERVLKTGRCHWWDKDRDALKLGKSREADWLWDMDAQGVQTLSLSTKPEAMIIQVTPPYYLDISTNVCGTINQPCSLEETRDLLNTLPLKPEDITGDNDILLPNLPNFIPQPERLTLQHEIIQPTVILSFDSVAIHSPIFGTHFDGLDVWFEYNEERTKQGATDEPVRIKQDNLLIEYARDTTFENSAMINLMAHGISETPATTRIKLKKAGLLPRFTLTAQDWITFMADIVPQLKSAGFEIEMSERFRYNLLSAQSWNLGVDGEGLMGKANFSATLEDGESIDLIDAIAAWIKEHPERLGDEMLNNIKTLEHVPLPLPDGRMLSIPGDMLFSILKHMMELFATTSVSEKDISGVQMLAIKQDLEKHEKVKIKDDKKWLELVYSLVDSKSIEAVEVPKGLQAELRDYQRDGLNWLQMMMRTGVHGILADDMGLGKTIQSLACILKEKEEGRLKHPALVIAPTSLMHNWRMEAQKFTPDLRVLVLHGVHRARFFDDIAQYDLVLTTYPLLPRDAGFLIDEPYHMLILDEAQNIKNPRAKASQLVREFNARHRLCLTGTPIENHLGELWAQFDFLMPGYLYDQKNFSNLFRKPIEQDGSESRQDALNVRVRPFLLRRMKEDVAKELPAKTNIIRSVELEGSQRALYESVRLAMQKKVRDSVAAMGVAKSKIIVLDALMKMRQVCCDPRLVKQIDTDGISSAKTDMLKEMLPEMVEEGRKILIFSQFAEMLRLIEDLCTELDLPYVKLTGQTKDRVTPVEAFQDGEVPIFLISLKAGGTGLNLTAADSVIHFDPWWNPAAEDQATDRAHRIGQDKPVFVYKLTTIGTVEEKILEMQERKRALANSIHGSGSKGSALWTEAELQSLFEPLADVEDEVKPATE